MYAQKNGHEDKVYGELSALGKAFVQYPALRRIMVSLMLSTAKKTEVVATIAGGSLSQSLVSFIKLLAKRDREEYLQEMCLSYQRIYRREKKLLDVELTTAVPVSAEIEKRMVKKLEEKTDYTVILNAKIDPSLIGGYVLMFDTYRLDTSVAASLRRIKKHLTETAINI
jgi:F-type H+-transporting ATPase subunit delta